MNRRERRWLTSHMRDGQIALLGGPGSGPREGDSHPHAGHGVTLTPTNERAWSGKQETVDNPMSKQEQGRLGEEIVIAHLKAEGFEDAEHLNIEKNNYPVDLVADHAVYEVKTGSVGNGETAQQWRATIGEPGPSEKVILSKLSPSEKTAWNNIKQQAILNRKDAAVKALSEKLGHPVKGGTITTIINPNTHTVDVYRFEGFHLRNGWSTSQGNYVKSYKYGH